MILKIRLPIQGLTVLLCAATVSAQENRGTPEQRAACAPDAFRLCFGYIPDPTSVEHCLRRNESDLSDACRCSSRAPALWPAEASREWVRPAISREAELAAIRRQ
jgi:hypothetical protein